MSGSKRGSQPGWIDPDDAPELTDEWFKSADQHADGVLVRKGRPPAANPKKAISLRVDVDVLDAFKAGGAGWQRRMNQALRKAMGL
ncbi:MAG: BrnA antitoxin family protein [Mesorhizobium sp.]|nr:BrnA antitoxin family protein [Mesorhizobium sp.]MCO5160077.1 BrnA antitoxin family protein [Mesorhizobium sp.]